MSAVRHLAELEARLKAAEELNGELQRALDSRVVIEQAQGVLAERLQLDVDDAFELLRYAARTARVKLHALAARVVEERVTPREIVVALARRQRWRSALMREHDEAARERVAALAAELAEQACRVSER